MKRSPGLFSGWWTDLAGKRIRKIARHEWPELYRLDRLCRKYEKQDKEGKCS